MPSNNVVRVTFIVDGPAVKQIAEIAAKTRDFGSTAQREFRRAEGAIDHAGRALERFHSFLANAASTAAGFVVGNVLTGGFTRLVGLVDDFAGKVVSGGKEATNAALFLRSAVGETGGSLKTATEEATNFARALGLTTAEAERLRATAEIGLQGTGKGAGEFLDRAADLAASRGIEIAELGTIITQIFNGADEGLGRLFAGKNPSTFFNEFAKATGRTVDSLTDVERRTILVNAVMQAAGKHVGEAGQKLQGLGGILGQINALIDELAGKIGEALSRNVGVLNILGRARDALLSLVTDGPAFDAFIQKVADGFVKAAGLALDFGTAVGRGLNEALGFVEKLALKLEQVGLQIGLSIRQAIDNVLKDIAKVGPDLLNFVKPALFVINPAGAGDAIKAAEGALSKIKEFGAEGDLAAQGVVRRMADLQLQILGVDKATEKANASIGGFFDSLRPGLADFAKFNPAAAAAPEAVKFVTRTIAEGDTLSSVSVAVQGSAAAAQTNAAAAVDIKTAVGTLVQTIQELAGLGRIEGAINGLKLAVEKGALIQVTAGLGTTVDELGAGLPLGNAR